MRVLSLFSGGGLGDYGLTLAGMEIVGQVEIDEYCQKILKLRWPDVPKWKDIREVKGADVIKTCGAIDLISGGFPCQDISSAGPGEGISGKRSGLWKEMHRIICEIRPKCVLVENVTALLGRGIDVVLGDLAACGYDTEWDCIPANSIGTPHIRDRIFIVCKRSLNTNSNMFGHEIRKKREKKYASGKQSFDKSCSMGKVLSVSSRIFRAGKKKKGFWLVEPRVGRMVDGSSNWMERLHLLGNGQVVQVVEWIGKRIMEYDKSISA